MIARSIAVAALALALLGALPAPAAAQFTYDHGSNAWLGIIMGGVSGGVLVEEVVPGTPAEHAGLEAGDVITSVGDTRVADSTELATTVRAHKVGDVVDLRVRRGKRTVTVSATLVTKPSDSSIRRVRLIDRRAPAFSMDVVSGEGSGRLSDYRGRVVVFVSWTLDCLACARVFRELQTLQDKYGDKLVVLVAAVAPRFELMKELEARPLPFAILEDEMGAVRRKYDLFARPSAPVMAVVDRQGFVRDVAFMAQNVSDLARTARRLLAEDERPTP